MCRHGGVYTRGLFLRQFLPCAPELRLDRMAWFPADLHKPCNRAQHDILEQRLADVGVHAGIQAFLHVLGVGVGAHGKEKKVFFAFAASQQKLHRLLNGITKKPPSQRGRGVSKKPNGMIASLRRVCRERS